MPSSWSVPCCLWVRCCRAVDLTAAKFHPRVGRFEHDVIEWSGEEGNPYATCNGIFHYLGSGADKPRPYANPYPSDVLVFSSGMHDDRPGHKSDFLGLEAFVANQLGNLFTSDSENSCVLMSHFRPRGSQTRHECFAEHRSFVGTLLTTSSSCVCSSDGLQ